MSSLHTELLWSRISKSHYLCLTFSLQSLIYMGLKVFILHRDVSAEFDQKGLKFSMTTEHIRNSYIQSVNVCDEDLITK